MTNKIKSLTKKTLFSIAYSKGVFNHIEDKASLLQDIYNLLKPKGTLIIADWIYPKKQTQSNSPLVKETKASYEKVLKISHFKGLHFHDDSQLFLGYVEFFLENLANHVHFIKKQFGLDLYKSIESDHIKLLAEIREKRKIAIKIMAHKNI